MKKQLIILLSFILSIQAFSQSTDQNWVKTTIYKKDAAHITDADKAITITYYDGLGRPIQVINHKQSVTGKDIVQHIEYDDLGRQTREYLPFSNDSSSLDYQALDGATAITNYNDMQGYENTNNPFSEKEFEASPLNRVFKQAAPGNPWALNNGLNHEIKFDYQANTTNDNVKLFEFSTNYDSNTKIYEPSSLQQNNTYAENQLYKNITVDENNLVDTNNQTEEFIDKQGKVVLKRIKANGEEFDTYYVYDDYGNLTFVIPPKAADLTINTTILNNLCYQYKYDYRNRLVAKKIPGKQWEYIVYDKLDRVRATGPTLSPFKNTAGQIGWLYTKYDVFDRPILTAWKQDTVSESTRFAKENDCNNLPLSESSGSSTVLTIVTPYTNDSYPRVGYHILSINYYDDYDFGLDGDNPTIPAQVLGKDVRDSTNGNCKTLATGSWVRILEDSNQVDGNLSYTFYKTDRLTSAIQNTIEYPNGGFTTTKSDVDFEGKTLKTITEHKLTNTSTLLTTEENYTYSPQGRLLKTTHKINGGDIENIATNHYKELGELASKDVGRTEANPLQTVDYTYNIRGWLTAINNVDNLTIGSVDDLFAFKINYNQPEEATALFNGNISETFWITDSDNIKRKYSYNYDGLNRLINADYSKPNISDMNTYKESLTYDKNGNIQTLNRNGGFESLTSAPAIDNLLYIYINNSNQLKKVVDFSGSPQGFKDDIAHPTVVQDDPDDDYNYDAYGNMIKDQNKNITNIKYNHLNLPIEIEFTSNRKIYYTYDAVGAKLKKDIFNGTTHVITDYINGYQYKDNKLQFFSTAEGYVKAVYNSIPGTDVNEIFNFNYVYNYTDHLGNIRLTYTEDDDGILKKLDETHYYPFGLEHSAYNQAKRDLAMKVSEQKVKTVSISREDVPYKYKYQGQERQDEFGLNWDSFKWRNYDYAIGRFMSIDPLAEDYSYQSPYNFSENRVVDAVELEGLEKISIHLIGSITRNNSTSKIFSTVTYDMGNNNKLDYVAVIENVGTIRGEYTEEKGHSYSVFSETPSTAEQEYLLENKGIKIPDSAVQIGLSKAKKSTRPENMEEALSLSEDEVNMQNNIRDGLDLLSGLIENDKLDIYFSYDGTVSFGKNDKGENNKRKFTSSYKGKFEDFSFSKKGISFQGKLIFEYTNEKCLENCD